MKPCRKPWPLATRNTVSSRKHINLILIKKLTDKLCVGWPYINDSQTRSRSSASVVLHLNRRGAVMSACRRTAWVDLTVAAGSGGFRRRRMTPITLPQHIYSSRDFTPLAYKSHDSFPRQNKTGMLVGSLGVCGARVCIWPTPKWETPESETTERSCLQEVLPPRFSSVEDHLSPHVSTLPELYYAAEMRSG